MGNYKKIITMIAILAVIIAVQAHTGQRKTPDEWKEYTVATNDTLYSISKEITPNNKDYRYTVHYITEKNNIKNSVIYQGDVILIPYFDK
jgi:LysM repeat protein